MKKTLLFLAAALTFGFAANAQTAFFEDFESTADGAIPTGWTVYGDGIANSESFASLDGVAGANKDKWFVLQDNQLTGGERLPISISWKASEGASNRWLVTPAIEIPDSGYSLTFTLLGYDSDYPENIRVAISTTDNQKTSFSTIKTINPAPQGFSYQKVDLPDSLAGQTVYIAFINQGDGYYGGVDNVKVSIIPENSLAYAGAYVVSYVPMGQDFNVQVAVFNDGNSNLTSFDIEYTLNGGDAQTVNATGLNIAPFSYGTYTFSTSYATAESLTIGLTVKNPNGEADANESDNSGSLTTNVYDPALAAERNTLLEHFTTGKCVWCPYGHQRMEEGIAGLEDRVAWVSHHVGYGTDEFTLTESNQIGNTFGLGGAPMMMIDRNAEFSSGSSAIGGVGEASQIRAQLTAAFSTPAFVTINLDNLSYDQQSRQLSVTVSGEFKSTYSGTPHLTLWIVEDSLIGQQADAYQGTIAKYQHNHVLRCLVNGIWGEGEAFSTTAAGDTYSKTYTFTLPTKVRANKARLVAFVNGYGTGAANRKVENTIESDFLLNGEDPTFVGITAAEAAISIKTYPNPATEMAYIGAEGQTIRSYEVVNTLGQKVLCSENVNADLIELNVSEMAAGVYFVTVRTDKGTATERLNVVK